MSRFRATIVPTLFAAAVLSLTSSAQTKSDVKKTEHMVPAEDGTELATDVYLPDDRGPFPVLLMRTPYGKAVGAGPATNLCKHGYAVVIQDLRGRFGSKGQAAVIFHN